MTAKLLLFLAVLKLTSSDPMPEPEPNVNVNVGVNVNDNNNGKGGLSCVFGDTCYPDGCILDTCLEMKCCNGKWKCTGKQPRSACGKCEAIGDPHMELYGSNTLNYVTNQTGEFALTQPGFSYSALFGVNANFEKCYLPVPPYWRSCIHSITYYEPGITVTLTLPPPDTDWNYCSQSSANANEPNCSIAICVNKEERPTPTTVCEANSFTGSDGNVLVFKQKHISGNPNLYCIAIVGSKGLSMALCQYKYNFPFFYIHAMPSLKQVPSLLEGLCDVYTGYPPTCYTMRNGTITCDSEAVVNSWRVTPVVNCP